MNIWIGVFAFICIVGGVGFWLASKAQKQSYSPSWHPIKPPTPGAFLGGDGVSTHAPARGATNS